MKKIICFTLILLSFQSKSQDTTESRIDSSSVVVHKDSRLDLLIEKQIQANELASRDARRIGNGFRLFVISTSNRQEAINAKAKVYTYFPELKVYLWHQSPYYKVKAGNFQEREDAEAYQKKLNVYFPNGVVVMNDKIELKLDHPWGEDL